MQQKIIVAVATFVVGAGLTACATPTPPRELVEARNSYQEASTGATLRLNPAGVDTARDQLAVAEDEFREHPRSQETRDRAYLADRAARLAIAQAQTKLAAEETANAQKQLGVVAQQNRAALDKTRSDLALTQQQGKLTEQQLAEQRAAAAAAQGELQKTALELETERQARAAAEQKLGQALADLEDLASVKEEARGLVITLSGQVLFASGKSQLLPAAQEALDNVAAALKETPDRKIVVEGHTDSQGGRSLNEQLSQDRANSVRMYLVDHGIEASMITARGYGPDRPVATNETAEGRANNRRVEIVVEPAPQTNSSSKSDD